MLSALIMVVGFFIAADGYINNQIENKITDETYIRKLSKTLRPFAIFNEQGVITFDHGGEAYIKTISVKKKPDGSLDSIEIETKGYLQNAPILIYLSNEDYSYQSNRTGTYVWSFSMIHLNTVTSDADSPAPPSFLIEIMQ